VLVALAAIASLAGCATHGPRLFGPAGGRVGYVDLDKVIAVHPLHGELDSMQAQITLLSGEAQNEPQPQTAVQAAALDKMQAELAAVQRGFEDEMSRRRAYYEQREAAAIAELQAKVTGASAPISQRYGQQAQQIQTDALKAFGEYQKQLYAADTLHLREVSRALQQQVATKLDARRRQLEKQETDYQINLAKQSQTQRLNLKTKLEDLNLSADERSQYTSQLQNIETREEAMVNALKAKDNSDLRAYEDQLQRDAAARFNTARTTAMTQTNQKLQARQKETSATLRTQLSGIGTQYQKQLASVNKQLQANPATRGQIAKIHDENQAQFTVDLNKALASYQQTRKGLVAKYSAVAGMQFQDTAELESEAENVAAQRRDLYSKILDQVQSQIGDIARSEGIALVFTQVRGSASAVDLTDQIEKAIAAPPNQTTAPSAAPSPGGKP
jgi:hypothetical protein